ncbi:ice nucleation protein [Dactylonectria estremocensis]|uniref:Crh-like protein n=1 Tax=Dactylonectria estremocensis TaxID=1079267 RepID=A0A9P9F280_9HYPO|nr:ice nucleation protein [Dactylonectria estremocensis]
MFSKAAALAIAAATLVSAQTYTDCNPLEKSCPADAAFGDKVINCDFTKGACSAFHQMDGTDLSYDSKGALFEIMKESNAPTIRSNNYMFFGRLDVVTQAANGQGIVSSVVLQSDDLDEIDWEWVGGDNAQVQTNFYSKGNTETYDRGAYHPVDAPLTSYHKYSFEWTSTVVNWLIDDVVVRTLNAADTVAYGFPQTPMQVKLGTWVAGGKNTAKGTVEWAGGYTNFDDAPFNAYYQSVTITDYMGKDAPGQNSNVKEYVYGDKSGSWESIVIKKGDGSDDDETTTTSKKTTSKTATKTKTTSTEETTTAEATTSTEAEETTSTKSKTTKTTASETASETTAEKTTFTTAAATTSRAAATTSGSGETAAAASGSETASGTASSSSETISTVPENAAPRMAGNVALACAGLFVAQLLI